MKKTIFLVIITLIGMIEIVLTLTKTEPIEQVDAATVSGEASDFANKINFDKVKNLMIVAHPDDETIWGGDHLLSEDYLVVCVTCGTNEIRDKEIRKVLNISEDELIKLGYPDIVDDRVSDWEGYKEDISFELTTIITMKEYEKIVTHNPQGEYGHKHHKMLNKMVTNITNRERLTEQLYYFAKYYEKNNTNYSDAKKHRVQNYDKKMQMINVYKSQSFIKNSFSHVMSSEKWQKYTDLKEELELKDIKA